MTKGAKQEENLLNTQGGSQLGNAQSIYSNVVSQSNKILANPVGPAQSAINAKQSAAQTMLKNRAAASHNTAGLVAGEDQAARQGGQLAGEATLGERDKAIQMQSGLYGSTLDSADSLYGTAQRAQSTRSRFPGIQTPWGGVGSTG